MKRELRRMMTQNPAVKIRTEDLQMLSLANDPTLNQMQPDAEPLDVA